MKTSDTSGAFIARGDFGGDANDITLPGVYRLNSGATNTDGEINGVLFHFEPMPNNHIIRIQIKFRYDGVNRCMRIYWYSTWSNWFSI